MANVSRGIRAALLAAMDRIADQPMTRGAALGAAAGGLGSVAERGMDATNRDPGGAAPYFATGAAAGAALGAGARGARALAGLGGLRHAIGNKLKVAGFVGGTGAAATAAGMGVQRAVEGRQEADALATGGARDMNEALQYLTQYLNEDELRTVAEEAKDVSEVAPILREIGYGDEDFRTWAMNAQQGNQ